MERSLRRRDFLSLSAVAVGGLSLVKVGGRWALGVSPPEVPSGPLTHLTPRQAATVTAAAVAMVGPRGEEAYLQQRWMPAADIDALLGRLPADQRDQIGLGLWLFEEWTPGLWGFSSWDRARQRAALTRWRTSDLGLQRGVWGFLHAAACSSFSGTPEGWAAMDYPGPCVGTGRAPGQSAQVVWDEVVP